jgi:integrase
MKPPKTEIQTTWKIQTKTIPHILAMMNGLPDIKDIVIWDEDQRGFGLRIQRGKKGRRLTYVIQYRTHAGRTRRMTIGDIELPAQEARKLAARELARAKTGDDPQGEKVAKRRAGSHVFKAVAESFIANKELPKPPAKPKPGKKYWRPSSAGQYRRILLDYCQPLHGFDIAAIKRGDISLVTRRVEDQRGTRSADLTRDRLQTLFTWAMGEGLTETNPVIGSRKIEYIGERKRVLSDDELARIWHACEPENFPRNGNFGRIIRMLILTGARRKEVTGMRRGEVHLEDAIWKLPAARAKNNREHAIPLSPPAHTILKEALEQKRWNGRTMVSDQFVFSSFGNMNVNRPLDALYELSGTKDWWLHDIRKTVATGMGNLGIAPHVISCVLNHVSVMRMDLQGMTVNVQGPRTGITGRYNLSPYHREMQDALNKWAEHIMVLVESHRRVQPAVPSRLSAPPKERRPSKEARKISRPTPRQPVRPRRRFNRPRQVSTADQARG